MQPLTQQVPGRLALGCLAIAGGIGASELPWDVMYASSAGVWLARVEGLNGKALYPGLVEYCVEGALGPLVGSCRAGLLHFKFDVVCLLSLIDKLALHILLPSAVAIQVGSGSWSRHGDVFHCNSSMLSVSKVILLSSSTRVKCSGSGNDRLESLIPPEDVHAFIACASSK